MNVAISSQSHITPGFSMNSDFEVVTQTARFFFGESVCESGTSMLYDGSEEVIM